MANLNLDAKRKARAEARAKSGATPNTMTLDGAKYDLRHKLPVAFAEALQLGDVTGALATIIVPGKGEDAHDLAVKVVQGGLIDEDDLTDLTSEVYGVDLGNSPA